VAGKIRRLKATHDDVFFAENIRPTVKQEFIVRDCDSRAEIELRGTAFPDYVGVAAHQKVGLVADIDDDPGVTGERIAERLQTPDLARPAQARAEKFTGENGCCRAARRKIGLQRIEEFAAKTLERDPLPDAEPEARAVDSIVVEA